MAFLTRAISSAFGSASRRDDSGLRNIVRHVQMMEAPIPPPPQNAPEPAVIPDMGPKPPQTGREEDHPPRPAPPPPKRPPPGIIIPTPEKRPTPEAKVPFDSYGLGLSRNQQIAVDTKQNDQMVMVGVALAVVAFAFMVSRRP